MRILFPLLYLSLAWPLSAFEVGTILPRPDLSKDLVIANKFSLKPTKLDPGTRVVVYFYGASWCAPCKQIGAHLAASQEAFNREVPEMEFITYSLDHSTRARADYLRQHPYPWPAIAPQTIEKSPWITSLEQGTPQFQAFAVREDTLEAIGAPGPAGEAIATAINYIAEL
ncbi:MAG: thioredoxin-like domain-containing protein [Verrucomicrobiota bacterium]